MEWVSIYLALRVSLPRFDRKNRPQDDREGQKHPPEKVEKLSASPRDEEGKPEALRECDRRACRICQQMQAHSNCLQLPSKTIREEDRHCQASARRRYSGRRSCNLLDPRFVSLLDAVCYSRVWFSKVIASRPKRKQESISPEPILCNSMGRGLKKQISITIVFSAFSKVNGCAYLVRPFRR